MASEKQDGLLVRVSTAVNLKLSGFFAGVGNRVGRYPWVTILVCLLVTMMGGSAFADFESDSDFVPSGTQALVDQADLVATYGDRPRFAGLLVSSSDGQFGNVLAKPILLAAFDYLQELQTNVSATYVKDDGSTATVFYTDVCFGSPACFAITPFLAWNNNRALLAADPNVGATLLATGVALTPDDPEATVENFFGGVEYTVGIPTSAAAIRLSLTLEFAAEDSEGEAAALAWEEAFVNFSLLQGGSSIISVAPSSIYSFGEEIGGSIQADVIYQTLSYFIILIYVVVIVQRKCDRVAGSTAVGLLAISTIGLAIISAFGVAQRLGQPYGNTHSVLPFIILGVGADGCFIILNSFRRTNYDDTLPQRASEALRHAGVSLTVSSVTNVVAFGAGALTVIPDLSSFCVYAALTFVFLWGYLATFFTACLVLNERRMLKGKLDVLCCFPDCRSAARTEASLVKEFTPGRLSRFFELTYTPFIMRPAVKAAVLLFTVVWFSYSAFNITKLTVEATSEQFIPDGSYLLDNFNQQALFFGGRDTEVSVVAKEFDYFAKREELAGLADAFRFADFETAPPFIRPTFDFWLDTFITSLTANATFFVDDADVAADAALGGRLFPLTSELFYEYLRLWLDDGSENTVAGVSEIKEGILFTDAARTQILRSRVVMDHLPIGSFGDDGIFKEDPAEVVKAVDKMYEITEGFSFEVFPFSFKYTSEWASYKIIAEELVQNIALALAAVFVVTFLLIGHPITSLIVFLSVVCTIVELLGMQTLLGFAIDTVVVVLIVIAVGIAVDYSAHIGYAFMTETGTRAERVAKTLGDVGVPVANGAISTFLAVMLQSLSASYVFRVSSLVVPCSTQIAYCVGRDSRDRWQHGTDTVTRTHRSFSSSFSSQSSSPPSTVSFWCPSSSALSARRRTATRLPSPPR